MNYRLCVLTASLMLSFNALADQWNCSHGHDGYASSLPVEVAPVESAIATAPVPDKPTAPSVTDGKILLAGDAPCNPKVTVCDD